MLLLLSMLRLRFYFSFFLFALFCFLVSAASVSAQTPRRYYDWSSTLDQNKGQVLGIQAFAQENAGSAVTQLKDLREFNRYFLGGNLTPSSPFYFIKPFQENLQVTFTFNAKAKEDLRVGIAGERVAEMQEMIEQKQVNGLSAAAAGYERAMTELADNAQVLKKQNVNINELLKEIEKETAKHNIVLEEAVVQVPDNQKESVEKAIEANWQGVDTVADLSNRPAVPPDVVDRIQALKAQGLLTEEEASKLIGVKNRSEARQELRKYVTEGVLPEADFMRMNENVKQLYPDDFYKIHEVKRFYEMKRLETEKPDDATLTKVQEFAKTYKQGEIVPADIRRYWVPVVRLEEIQNTLRPDLIDPNFFKNRQDDYKKFTEVVERFKPKPEDLAYINNYIEKNNADVNNLPPEYQRMYKLAKSYGAQCGAGQHWVSQSQGGGVCVPDGSNFSDLPKVEDFAKGKSCSGAVTAAKGPGGSCSAYPADCVPPGWTVVSTCVETPRGETKGGQFGQTVARGATSCPSNAHFVAVPFDPNGGYCIPDYTSTQTVSTGTGSTFTESTCPAGYHRNYPGGPCLQDYGSNRTGAVVSLPPLTSTPGNYPNPIYSGGSFGPQPTNPYQPSSGTSVPSSSGTSPSGYGNCPSGMSWNGSYCNGASPTYQSTGSYSGSGTSGGTSGGTYQPPAPYYSQPPTQTTTSSPAPSEQQSSSPAPSSPPPSESSLPPSSPPPSSQPPPSSPAPSTTTTTSGCGGGSGTPC